MGVTIKVKAEQLPLTIELLPPPVPPPPPEPQARISVDRTRTSINQLEQCLAIVTNEFIYPNKAVIVDIMAPHMRELYSQVSFHLSGGFGTSDSWEWNPASGPKPAAPKIHPSLIAMTALATKFGKDPLLTVYRPSWHQKYNRGTPLTYALAYGPGSNETGRLGGQYKDEWRLMTNEMVYSVASQMVKVYPDIRFDNEIHNEFKGMWELLLKDKLVAGQNWADGENPGTSGYGDIDYGPYYDLSIKGCLDGYARAGIGEDRLRFGGPYAVLQSRGNRTANALPVGHPLADRPWGHMSKMPIYAIERFLKYVKKYGSPLHYLVVDGGTYNNDDVHYADVWTQLKKVSEANYYIRFMLDEAGFYRTPIWWAERYLTERPLPGMTTINQFQDSMPRRASVLAAGLCEMAYSGAGRIFQWGFRGEDGDPFYDPKYKENAAHFTAQGQTTLMYDVCLLFKKTFPLGCCLHPVVSDNPAIDGLSSDDIMLLYNKTDKNVLVDVWGQLVNFSPCQVRTVLR